MELTRKVIEEALQKCEAYHGAVTSPVSVEVVRALAASALIGVTQVHQLPEGWVAVPILPTEDMITNGFESVPDPHFSNEKEWKEYEALSGCRQAARRAELCWAAMIAAAPKQEVK